MDKLNSSSSTPASSAEPEVQKLTYLQVLMSILSSFFGVQSSKNQKRDFAHGKARQFIAVGIVMTIVWYVTIAMVVRFVLHK